MRERETERVNMKEREKRGEEKREGERKRKRVGGIDKDRW